MVKNDNLPTSESLDAATEHAVRLNKVQVMYAANIQPWPEYKPVSTTTAQALTNFTKHQDGTIQYTLAGRLMSLRDHGKTFFAHLQDRDGQLQLYIKKDTLGDEVFENFKKYIDVGDIIFTKGTLFTTKKGEITLDVRELILLSKCLHPLPEKYHGLADVEQRYRQRYLDLISNPEAREKFKNRSKIIQSIRTFLQSKDFIEVETPMLHPIPGGAAARPFVTHHNAYDMDLFLRIAPELYLKRLVIGGFERVFEINRNFRNEGISTRHNPEFTMLEFYLAHGDVETGMALVEELIKTSVISAHGTTSFEFQDKNISVETPFNRLTVEQALIELGGLSHDKITPATIDATMKQHNITLPGNPGYGMKLFGLFEELVETKIVQPTFITGYPLEVSPLAKKDPKNPDLTARAELFIVGMEFANLFTELNDPIDQTERFKQQAGARDSGDHEAHHYDADFIKALEYGLPPTVGVGIGIDRLVMLLTNTGSIKDVILFPTLKLSTQSPKNIARTNTTYLRIEPAIFEQFPGTTLGVVVAFDVKNEGTENQQISNLLRKQENNLRELFKKQSLSEHTNIVVWREAYQKFGADPEKYRSSIENLSSRILKEQSIKHVNTLVDLYNYISLKYLLPAGGEDINHLDGNVHLTIAENNEIPVVAFGEKEAKRPEVGEVIYKDRGGTICRRWNWRGTERSKLTTKTQNAFFIFEALPPIKKETVQQAMQEFAELLTQYCGGTTRTVIVDKTNPQTSLIQQKD